jgi:predicted nucleic acid-binding protein
MIAMAESIVIDSGIFIATYVQESFTPQSQQLVDWASGKGLSIVAPTLLRYEVVATMRKLVYLGRIPAIDGEEQIRKFRAIDINYLIDDTLLDRGYALATEFNFVRAYDSQYLAVAESLGCDFWTIDQKLFNTVRHKLGWVRYIEDFQDLNDET